MEALPSDQRKKSAKCMKATWKKNTYGRYEGKKENIMKFERKKCLNEKNVKKRF